MARFPFDIWIIRKQKTYESIVEQGVTDPTSLDEFLTERGVAMPVDLSPFNKLWERSAEKSEKKTLGKKRVTKATAKSTTQVREPVKKTSTPRSRTTRKKANIRDRASKD